MSEFTPGLLRRNRKPLYPVMFKVSKTRIPDTNIRTGHENQQRTYVQQLAEFAGREHFFFPNAANLMDFQPSTVFVEYCTISNYSAVTRHTRFFLTPDSFFFSIFPIFLDFSKFQKSHVMAE